MLYCYVDGNPVIRFDPFGLWFTPGTFMGDYEAFLFGADAPADPAILNYGSEIGFGVAGAAVGGLAGLGVGAVVGVGIVGAGGSTTAAGIGGSVVGGIAGGVVGGQAGSLGGSVGETIGGVGGGLMGGVAGSAGGVAPFKPILVEGIVGGGSVGSGGVCQLRPAGGPHIIRFDFHGFPIVGGPKGAGEIFTSPPLPHVDIPALGVSHFPWWPPFPF